MIYGPKIRRINNECPSFDRVRDEGFVEKPLVELLNDAFERIAMSRVTFAALGASDETVARHAGIAGHPDLNELGGKTVSELMEPFGIAWPEKRGLGDDRTPALKIQFNTSFENDKGKVSDLPRPDAIPHSTNSKQTFLESIHGHNREAKLDLKMPDER
jgi:hypothetical protein